MTRLHHSKFRHEGLLAIAATIAISGILPAELPQSFNVDEIDGFNGRTFIGAARSISGVGDIDADGYDDILIGNPEYGQQCRLVGVCFSRGIIHWLRGNPSHGHSPFDLSTLSMPEGVSIPGPLKDSGQGFRISGIGDFNGDQISDFIYTSRKPISDDSSGVGEYYVIFGREGGFPEGFDRNYADGVRGFRIEGSVFNSISGAGDINGDGFDDIALGDTYAYDDYGAVWIVFGKETPLGSQVINVSNMELNDGIRIYGAQQNAATGVVSGIGDYDGDGIDDILISASKYDYNALSDSGTCYIINGKTNINNIELADLDSKDGLWIIGTMANWRFASETTPIGDINGDGYHDILLGQGTADLNGLTNSGRANTLLGMGANVDAVLFDYEIMGSYGSQFDGINAFYRLTSGVGVGDINGDGLSDFTLQRVLPFKVIGEQYVVFSTNPLPPFTTIPSPELEYLSKVVGDDKLLYAANSPAGDFNGDGFNDFVLRGSQGEFYLFFGSGTSQQATYKSFARADDAPISGIGYIGNGTQSSPSSRLWVDFELGGGPGKNGSSLQTVTITRSNSELSNIENSATVYWYLETVRENYIVESRNGITSGRVNIMVKYLDGEVWHLEENSLELMQAPSPDGPWRPMQDQHLNTAQNRIKARVDGLLPQYFAIRGGAAQTASIPSPSLLTLTPFTDCWLSPVSPAARFFQPARLGFTGFQNNTQGWRSFSGDFNGDGLNDVSTITPWGEWHTAYAGQTLGFIPTALQSVGWVSDPTNGWLVLSGDFNGDGKNALLQFTADGSIFQNGSRTMGVPPEPAFLTTTNLRHDPANGNYIFSADINGDGMDDLININNSGVLTVEVSNGINFNPTQTWGQFGFKHDPATKRGVHFGDFNGDGRDDICQITQYGDAWVALSTGSKFNSPTRWGWLGFSDDPNRGDGWYVFVADIDRDGRDDLVQLTDIGEVWIARSNGANGFLAPTRNAQLGFHHKPDGPWQVFVVE